jgi:hypothetical protein
MQHQSDTPITIKKHWINYILPGFLFSLGLLILLLDGIFFKIVGGLWTLYCILLVLTIASVKWTLTDKQLTISKGVLPWNKVFWQIPIFDIYEAIYNHNIIGYYLGYGQIIIRRTEGVTSSIEGFRLANANSFAKLTNQLAQEQKSLKHSFVASPFVSAPSGKSLIDELQHLADLRKSGDITQAEYDHMKAILMARS